MSKLTNIALFLIASAIGFFAPSMCFYYAVQMGWFDTESLSITKETFETQYAAGTIFVWIACMAVALIGLFIKSPIKYLLFLLPAIAPYVYGFRLLLIFTAT